ncbi:MAG: DUF4349 domain-containing protein [Acidimicrobiales bacterium]
MAHVNNHRSNRRVGAMSVIGLVSLLALVACAGDDEDSASMATTYQSPDGGGPPTAAPAETLAAGEAISADDGATEDTEAAASETTTAAGGFEGDGFTGVQIDVAPDRLLAVDVTAAVEVADVSTALSQVVDIAGRHQGQVYGSDVSLGDPETAKGSVVIKLPPDEVEAAIVDISALGRLVGRFQDTEDVTDRVTDVETRILSAQQSVDRVQAMLADAKDLGEVVMLEGELTTRQLALEELLAQQRNLTGRTALATLTVELSTATVEEAVAPTTTTTLAPVPDETVGDAFASGGHAFVVAGTAVLMFIGYTAPFLAIGLVVLLVLRRVARRRPHPAPVDPAGSTG